MSKQRVTFSAVEDIIHTMAAMIEAQGDVIKALLQSGVNSESFGESVEKMEAAVERVNTLVERHPELKEFMD